MARQNMPREHKILIIIVILMVLSPLMIAAQYALTETPAASATDQTVQLDELPEGTYMVTQQLPNGHAIVRSQDSGNDHLTVVQNLEGVPVGEAFSTYVAEEMVID